jgi:hypothetical protein
MGRVGRDDLHAGARLFCENHPGTQLKYDVCHKKAPSLSKFVRFAPPRLRSKARYMNLDSLVKWGCTMLNRYVILPKRILR